MKNFIGKSVAILREKFHQSIGLPFAQILPESTIEKALKAEGISYRKRLFCPIVTLWAWTSQVLDKDKSCKKAVSRVVSYLIASGQTPPSTNTGAYCKARKRLKENFLLRLLRKVAQHLHDEQPDAEFLWCGRRTIVFDGSTLTMEDTEKISENTLNPRVKPKVVVFHKLGLFAALIFQPVPSLMRPVIRQKSEKSICSGSSISRSESR